MIGPSIAYIPLTQGFYALIDVEDIPRAYGSWTAKRSGNCIYAHAKRDGAMITLHRFLLGKPDMLVDHKNRDGLDNRRANLRLSTLGQNQWNRKISRLSKTGLKGVHKEGNRWMSYIDTDRKRTRLGVFSTPEEAHVAYRAAADKLHGDFANYG